MATLEGLRRKIDSTRDLGSVVKTMKALAAVNIRQFEKSVAALKTYNRTVQLGLQAVLRNRPGFSVTARTPEAGNLGAVVFGTDQGMCGPLNDTIVSHALETLDRIGTGDRRPHIISVGERARNHFMDEGLQVQRNYAVPGSAEAVTGLVQDLVLEIERWHENAGPRRVLIFHSSPRSGASYRPRQVRLLPVDRRWLREFRDEPWPGRQLPWFSMDWDELFAALMRQYLFVSLYRAAVESLAAENASRLAAMQGAESSVEERLETLENRYHRQRQLRITEELLDIVSGFEALRSQGSRQA
jgi:F-type H+-transporting ATPase subunit gamma